MDLIPIIIIVSLLGFFIILTAVLFTWQYLKAREQRKRRQDSESQEKPTRHLTVRSGQVIPKSEAAETASTRDPASFDLPSPETTYTVKCEAERRNTSDTWPPKVAAHRQDKSSKATDMEAQSKDAARSKVAAYTWPPKPTDHSQRYPFGVIDLEAQTRDAASSKIAESEPFRRKEEIAKARAKLSRPILMTQRSGSLTLPRPALVTIESRRPSAAKSHDSQSRRTSKSKSSHQSRHPSSSKNREITESLQKAYTGPSVLGGEAHQLPASPVLWNSSFHTAESRRASGRRSSGRSADGSTVSSRVISDSVQRPPPLFSAIDYSPHVSFAPVQYVPYDDDDVNRVSFLSMTDSASSSYTTEQVSPVMRAPPPSLNEVAYYETFSPVSAGLLSNTPSTLGFIRDTPPQLGTPDFGNISFFDSTRSSDESNHVESPKKLQRGVSVMSNRSILTIASSEISSNWTIGNAQVVNIYPSVAQEKERATPPYARRLRSKYGRYPRGRGDKALPGIPKSPLWQNDFGELHDPANIDTKFPSIEKLRHLVRNLQYNLGDACPKQIPLIGTTKLHGAHVDVVIDASSNIRLQSRNILDLTVENDVHGFAKWMAFQGPIMLALRDAHYAMFCKLNPETPIDPAHPFILACEFIGKGIQKGVAIAQLDKRLVILTASINGTWLPDEPYADLVAEDRGVYHVTRGGVWHIDLELQQPGRTEEEMQGLVAAVERECPFAKTFGVKGTGEGIVWKVADTLRFQGPRYWCKTKGEKHTVSHTDKVDGRLGDKEKLAAFADAVVTQARLEQGWAYLEEPGAPRDVSSTGAFVKWLVADCVKEEREEIKEKGVDVNKLRGAIAGKGSVWFRKRLEEG